jgi:hypothetical protein
LGILNTAEAEGLPEAEKHLKGDSHEKTGIIRKAPIVRKPEKSGRRE